MPDNGRMGCEQAAYCAAGQGSHSHVSVGLRFWFMALQKKNSPCLHACSTSPAYLKSRHGDAWHSFEAARLGLRIHLTGNVYCFYSSFRISAIRDVRVPVCSLSSPTAREASLMARAVCCTASLTVEMLRLISSLATDCCSLAAAMALT